MNTTALLLEHLSDRDVEFLVRTVVTRRSDYEHICGLLRDKPDLIDIMLDDPQLYERVAADPDIVGKVSPYFFFSVLLRQVRRELRTMAHTLEYGPDQTRVPVFDAGELRAVLDDAARRDYLADLLASFTRTQNEAMWLHAGERVYRWRFSELDLAALERLRGVVDERDRFAVDRRIGDLTLFLAGTCADPDNRKCLLDAVQQARTAPQATSFPEVLEALENRGREAFLQAAQHPIARATGADRLLASLAESMRPARKVLNLLMERHVEPFRKDWFKTPLLEAGR